MRGGAARSALVRGRLFQRFWPRRTGPNQVGLVQEKPSSTRRIEARIERESFLSFQLVSSGCASGVEQQVPAFLGHRAGDDDEDVLFEERSSEGLLSPGSATLAVAIPDWARPRVARHARP